MSVDSVLVVEDELRLRSALCEFLESKGLKTIGAGTCKEAEYLCRSQHPDAAILDYELPDGNGLDLMPRLRGLDEFLPIIFLTGYGSIQLAVDAIKLGADQFLTKPAELPALWVMVQRSIENHRSRQTQLAQKSSGVRAKPDPFAGKSGVIQKLADLAKRVLNTNSPVLIQGETGVGKGVLARWLHQNGSRGSRTLVELNCGGLSRELLETELFGHEKGAFTGAVQSKPGLLEVGHKGTVFLDEIGDMDAQVQAKLLKVLEEKAFRRLGDVRERLVDIRLIAATHRNLSSLIKEKKFRDDLYFRISTITLVIPPLRERPEDIPILARNVLDRVSHDLGLRDVEITGDAMRYLQVYSWPGNVRELRNILERAILLGDQKRLKVDDLHFDLRLESPKPMRSGIRTLEEIEQDYIQQVLELLGGKVGDAAKKLGIPRSSLYSKVRQYRIVYQPEMQEGLEQNSDASDAASSADSNSALKIRQ